MKHTIFIASRLKFRRRIVTISVAVSYFVMIIAMAVSSGFRCEVRNALSLLGGDIQLCPANLNFLDEARPVDAAPSYLPLLEEVDGVESVEPVVYRAGIVKLGDNIQGVMVKGVPSSDSTSLSVSIPRRLSEIGGIGVGDKMLTYFVGEKVKVRNFTVASIYDPAVEAEDRLVVYADMKDMQRLNGWSSDQASLLEIRMKPRYRDEANIEAATQEVGFIAYAHATDEMGDVFASSTPSRYPQLFDWLDLLDFNVLFVLVLMMLVAGFNMISGLLITLFENISTIGVFKAMGMTHGSIAKVFLVSSASTVLKGMLVGNAVAVVFCLLQDWLHLLKLDPVNYFVSFVPVEMDIVSILSVDLISFALIMLLLLVPCSFISRIDPADTVRVR
jgi:lipoprotein-releasing system permease protein